MAEFNEAHQINWPAGHRSALCPIILFDAPSASQSEEPRTGLDYSLAGFDRLLTIFTDLDVTATVGVTEAAESFAPTLVAKAASLGFELVRWSNPTGPSSPPTDFPQEASQSDGRGLIAGLPHIPAPAQPSPESDWIIDGSGGDRPTMRGNECLIPTSPYWTDQVWLDPARPLPPSSFLEAWSLSLAEVRSHGALMTVLLHAEISGRLGISSQVLRFLDEVIESGDVWITGAGQIANWWRQELASRSTD